MKSSKNEHYLKKVQIQSQMQMRNKIHVLMVIPYFIPSEFGGTPQVVLSISKELVRLGHKVTILTTNAYNQKTRWSNRTKSLIKKNLIIVYLNCFTLIGNLTFAPQIVLYYLKHYKKFDFVHIHELRSIQNFLLFPLLKATGRPFGVAAHGAMLPIFSKIRIKKFFDPLLKIILKKTDVLFASTSKEGTEYLSYGVNKKKIVILPNGLSRKTLDKYEKIEKKQKNFFIEKQTILYLGRVHPIKGLSYLIESFKILTYKYPDLELIIAGSDDGDLENLNFLTKKLKIDHKVKFTGFVSESTKIQLLNAAQIYVLPSLFENFPISILEAWASKTPVLASNMVGMEDKYLLKAGKRFNHDPLELAKKIDFFLANKDYARNIGLKGFELVQNELNWNKIVRSYLKVYVFVIKEKLIIRK